MACVRPCMTFGWSFEALRGMHPVYDCDATLAGEDADAGAGGGGGGGADADADGNGNGNGNGNGKTLTMHMPSKP
jgi:hypothetical protein